MANDIIMFAEFFVLLSSEISSPSFDCRKATSVIDRAICSRPQLAALDARLAVAFSALQANLDHSSAELMEQRLWLSRRAERCSSPKNIATCLATVYKARLTDLKAAAKVDVNEPIGIEAEISYPPTSDRDLEVCRAVAKTVQRNSLTPPKSSPFLKKAFWMDGAVEVGLGADDRGTSHSSAPSVASKGILKELQGQFAKPNEDAGFHNARWFFYHKRPYIIGYSDWSDIYPESVSALQDDLSERPLCRLRAKVKVRLTPIRPVDSGICSIIWNAGGKNVAPKKLSHIKRIPDRPDTYIQQSVVVDSMNNSRPISMFLYAADSGAGSGCSLRYYDTAPSDNSSTPHKAWNAAQGLDVHDVYARRTCADGEPVWKRVAGKTYLLSRSDSARDPHADEQEFLAVDTVEGEKPRAVCRGDFSRRAVLITDVWREGGWQPFIK